MLTREQITEAEQIRNKKQLIIHHFSATNGPDTTRNDEWKKAAFDFYDTVVATDYLWSEETRHKIREGDSEAIADALLFLEVDPYYFRSGYLKEWLLDSLKNAPLTTNDKAEIKRIILKVLVGPNRREFHRYCRLATRVTSADFEHQVEQLGDKMTKGKCSYLLDYLKKHRAS